MLLTKDARQAFSMFFTALYSFILIAFIYMLTMPHERNFNEYQNNTSHAETTETRDLALRKAAFAKFLAEQRQRHDWSLHQDTLHPEDHPVWNPPPNTKLKLRQTGNLLRHLISRMNLSYQCSEHHSPELANDRPIVSLDEFRDYVVGRMREGKKVKMKHGGGTIGFLDATGASPHLPHATDFSAISGQAKTIKQHKELNPVGLENGMAAISDHRLLRILAKRRERRFKADKIDWDKAVEKFQWDRMERRLLPELDGDL